MATVQSRFYAVRQALANSAIEGFSPDAADVANLRAFVAGVVDASGLVYQARMFVLAIRTGEGVAK